MAEYEAVFRLNKLKEFYNVNQKEKNVTAMINSHLQKLLIKF